MNDRCVNPKCFAKPLPFHRLCRTCNGIAESALVVGVCFGVCVLIIALCRIGGMI